MKENKKLLLKTVILASLSFLFWGQCVVGKVKSKSIDDTSCDRIGFTWASIEQTIILKKTFVVKSICGTASLADGTPMIKGVLFEIRKKDKNWKKQKIYRTSTDEKGNFCIKGVKKGIYCFKTTFEGWQSFVGEILLTDSADENSKIILTMELGF